MHLLHYLHKPGIAEEKAGTAYLTLQKRLLHTCMLNFVLLAFMGLLLRAYPVFSIPFFSYKNLLHAHSHFAFGGWVVPALLFLLLRFFPVVRTPASYPHWRNSIVLLLFSAYGMLLSFPVQGYGVISIFFSTLSIAAGFYAGIIARRNVRKQVFLTSSSFLLAGFFYFFISAIGPFAMGPLIAIGKAGTAIYYNAIYFYLHFQYNGFFTFIILAVLYKMIEHRKPFNHGEIVFRLLNIACIPAYFLSVLWTQPPPVFYIIGATAAILQLIAIKWLLKDIKGIGWKNNWQGWLFRLSIIAFIVKSILQLLSAIPLLAALAYQNRNFIIAYLHLALIGFISTFIFAVIMKSLSLQQQKLMHRGLSLFFIAFFTTELLLVLQGGGYLSFFPVLAYLRLLFGFSILFPLGLVVTGIALLNNNKSRAGLSVSNQLQSYSLTRAEKL